MYLLDDILGSTRFCSGSKYNECWVFQSELILKSARLRLGFCLKLMSSRGELIEVGVEVE